MESPEDIDSKKKLNVLFIGHHGAGKSTAIQKILNQDEVEDVKGASDFGDKVVKFKTTEFHILEFPSHYPYVPGLMSRASRTDIAVLLVSCSDIDLPLKMHQTEFNVDFMRTFKISNIVLVLRKIDDSSSCGAIVSKISARIRKFIPEFEKVVVKELSLSCHTDSGINELLSSLVAIEVPPQPSQRDLRSAAHTGIYNLVAVDLDMDDLKVNMGATWYRRANALLELGVYSEIILGSDQPWVHALFSELFKAIDQARSLELHKNHRWKKTKKNLITKKLDCDELRATKQYKAAIEGYGKLKKEFEAGGAKGAVSLLDKIIDETKQEWREKAFSNMLDNFNKKIDASPSDASLWFDKAIFLLNQEKIKEGFDAAKKALEYNYLEHPSSEKETHALLYKLKGDRYCEQKQYGSAAEMYQEAYDAFTLKSCKEIIQAALNECIALVEKETQLKNIDKSLCQDATNAMLWYEKTNLLIDLERFDDAFKAAERASDYHSHPSEDSALFHIIQGHNYFAKNDFNAAFDNYKKARDMFASAKQTEAVSLSQDLVTKAFNASLYPPDSPVKDNVEIKQKNVNRDESKEEISDISDEQKKDISDEQKRDISDEQKKDISDDIVETESSKQVIKVASSEFLIDNQSDYSHSELLLYGVVSGLKCMSNGVQFQKSLIECTYYHKHKFEDLMFLGLGSNFILRVEEMSNLTVCEEQKTYLCVECVRTLESHFTLRCQRRYGDEDFSSLSAEQRRDIVRDWWYSIKSYFKKVFSDIVNGLLFLYSRGFACGKLLNSVFVNKWGHGKVLPSMDSTVTHQGDVHDLSTLMKRIIYLPFPGQKYLLDDVPDEVQMSISFLETFKGKQDHLPLSWIIDHPLFWTPLKRAYFIINLRRKMPNYSVFYHLLEESLEEWSVSYKNWANMIPDDDKNVFRKIWSEGDPSGHQEALYGVQSSNTESHIIVRPYSQGSDLLRYMNAVYGHHNDGRYKTYREKVLELPKIDEELRRIFPNVHELAYSALCGYFVSISEGTHVPTNDEFDVNSEDWKLPPLVK